MEQIVITSQEIGTQKWEGELVDDGCCGAVVWFVGRVRNENEGRRVKSIFYECYEPMAKKELEKIFSEAKARWDIHQIILAHRTGVVTVGEESLVLGLSSPHRKEAFEAVQYIVDQLKQRVPIWKKENDEGGEAQWLNE